jgi:hypothetical protein
MIDRHAAQGETKMPATLKRGEDGIYDLRISGTLTKSEFAVIQSEIAKEIDEGAKPQVLAFLDDFRGWERRADWDDLDFLISHSGEITKIAIVGEPKWETEALAFSGAGIRAAPVKFFRIGQEAQARDWLAD